MNFVPRVSLKNISEGTPCLNVDARILIQAKTDLLTEARKLTPVEHKAFGYHPQPPPPGSLAAEAQAEAVKHPQVVAQICEEQLQSAALADAERIKNEREGSGVHLSVIGQGVSGLSHHDLYFLIAPFSPSSQDHVRRA